MKEEQELICIKEPKVFLFFGLVVSNLVVYLKEEILRNTDKVVCVYCSSAVVLLLLLFFLLGKIIIIGAGK